MRLIITIAFLVLSIMIPCIAEPDSITTGPYNVSFDLGIPKDAYTVEVAEPKEEESLAGNAYTTYDIQLRNKTPSSQWAVITLVSYDDKQKIPSQDDLLKSTKLAVLQIGDISNLNGAKRRIDGHDGAVAFGKVNALDMETYLAIYYPSQTEKVLIGTMYPWDEGALQLLKTIHVKKINSTS